MGFQRNIRIAGNDALDRALIFRARSLEKRKFHDPRRREIYESVTLTHAQMHEIDELYYSNYGERIPYTWHRHFTAMSGRFDSSYFPELLFIPEFERFENLWPEYVKVYADKNVLPILARCAGVRMPKSVIWSARGVWHDDGGHEITRDDAAELLNDAGECFAKPTVDSCSGRGCCLVDFMSGIDRVSNRPVIEVLRGMGADCVIQERLRCHESITRLYPNAVNTFRIMTYRWGNELCVAPAIMRIGRGGGYLDNAHQGGVFIAVDDCGRLGSFALTEFNERFERHPDTGVLFDRYRIEGFARCVDAAFAVHRQMPQIGVANWDFTLDEAGEPVLLEVNLEAGGIWVFQMAHGCGPFGERTPEILRWMRKMKSLPASLRAVHAFGKS